MKRAAPPGVNVRVSELMPRSGAIIFGDLVGKLGLVRVACLKCDRKGQYRLAKLIAHHGRDGRLVDFKDQITSDCPRRANDRVALHEICGACFP